MSTKQRSRATQARKRHIGMQLRASLEALDRATSMPKGAARLAGDLIAAVAMARLKLSNPDAMLGAMCAAYITALDCGTTRADFVAWLRRTAANLSRT
jgi:hypothetical protein